MALWRVSVTRISEDEIALRVEAETEEEARRLAKDAAVEGEDPVTGIAFGDAESLGPSWEPTDTEYTTSNATALTGPGTECSKCEKPAIAFDAEADESLCAQHEEEVVYG